MRLPLYIYFIFFSLAVALFCYRRLKPGYLVWFIPFLVFTLLTELTCAYYKYILDRSNGWLYNVYLVVQVIFFAGFFYYYIPERTYRMLVVSLLLLFAGFVAAEYGWISSISAFSPAVFISGGLITCLFGVFFLFYYFSLNNPAMEKALVPVLWITAGIILYFCVLSITISLYHYLLIHDTELFGQKLYNLIPRILSILLYSSFAYAFFLCLRRKEI